MKKQILKSALLAMAGVGLLGGNAMSYTVEHQYVAGSTYDVNEIFYQAYDTDMLGMDVTVSYFNTSNVLQTVTLEWTTIAAGRTGIQLGDDFSIIMFTPSDTYSDPWGANMLLTSDVSISSVKFDGISGGVVFDTDTDGTNYVDTQGSEGGLPFQVQSLTGTWNGKFSVTYSDLVSVGENTPAGDLYRYMQIDFVGPYTNSFNNGITFKADTDIINPVPEPATMLLFGTGLAGLAAVARRRKTQA